MLESDEKNLRSCSCKCIINFVRQTDILEITTKVEIFWEIVTRNRNLSESCLVKIKIFGPGSMTPQISNQIDAAGRRCYEERCAGVVTRALLRIIGGWRRKCIEKCRVYVR